MSTARIRTFATAMSLALVASIAPSVGARGASADAHPVPVVPGASNLFVDRRADAIAAARQRLLMDVRAGTTDRDSCAIVPAEIVASAAGAAGIGDINLAPWPQFASLDAELPSNSGDTLHQTPLRCWTSRPASDATVRPSVVALVTETNRTASDAHSRPLAALLGIEPIVPVRSATIGGEVAGSCQATITTGVCSALWIDRGLMLGVQLDGPPATVTPASTATLLDGLVPATVNRLAVRSITPPSCDVDTIAAWTGVQLLDGIVCSSGWAAGVTEPCADYGCAGVELFHMTPTGWVARGSTRSACPEGIAAFGPTRVTATELAEPFRPRPLPVDQHGRPTWPWPWHPLAPCNPNHRALAVRSLRAGSQGPRVVALQAALVAMGYDLPVDGRFGPLTVAAVLDFQTLAGITVDALVGSQTRGAMGV